MTDRPFGCPLTPHVPIVTVLDLPCPPSTNSIWKGKGFGKNKAGVYLSPQYKAWIKESDMAVMVQGALRGRKVIAGPFSARIEVKRPGPTSDIDNRIKAVLDYAQSRGFVSNDKHLVSVTACWSDVSERGCRLTLTEVVSRETAVGA